MEVHAGKLLEEGRDRLRAAGIDRPFLDSSLLLARALGIRREQLYLETEAVLSSEASARYASYIDRRLSGECIAYILGYREFWGLPFSVSPAVLVPRPDTEILVEAALEILNAPAAQPLSALDLCTGSGAAAVAVKHRLPQAEVWASDISEEALKIAGRNAERFVHGSIRFCHGDLFDALDNENETERRFFLIMANAPYIPSSAMAGLPAEVQKEPRLALDGGKDGLDLIRRIIAGAGKRLVPGARLLLEADGGQMKTIRSLLKDRGFTGIQTKKDLSGRERVITGKLP